MRSRNTQKIMHVSGFNQWAVGGIAEPHQHATNNDIVIAARQRRPNASRGGFSTKLHLITDGKGRPLHVTLTPGHRHEMTKADELLEHVQGRALIGDTGYDSDDFARKIRRRGMKVVICCNPTRKKKLRRLDRKLYRRRYRVECSFHGLKRFRAVASRYDKTATNYLAMVEIACAWQWLN